MPTVRPEELDGAATWIHDLCVHFGDDTEQRHVLSLNPHAFCVVGPPLPAGTEVQATFVMASFLAVTVRARADRPTTRKLQSFHVDSDSTEALGLAAMIAASDESVH
jgi:hypothetical protein